MNEDSSTNLLLADFVACSGAKVNDVLFGGVGSGSWNEPAQVDSLTSDTDIVTITVGGNDVGFSDYASGDVQLITGVLHTSPATTLSWVKSTVDLQQDLETTYQTILSRAPNATVYVLGYPQLVDPYAQCVSFGWGEDYGAISVVSQLDSKIHDAVLNTAASTTHPSNAGRIHYIEVNQTGSPFENHYLCSTTPYFNNVVVADPEYSYHPNLGGQEAYKQLIVDAIN